MSFYPKDLAPWVNEDWPKFLVGDTPGEDGRVYVIHLHWPRFVGKVEEVGIFDDVEIKPTFIDPPASLSETELAALMRECGDFYATVDEV